MITLDRQAVQAALTTSSTVEDLAASVQAAVSNNVDVQSSLLRCRTFFRFTFTDAYKPTNDLELCRRVVRYVATQGIFPRARSLRGL